MSTVQSLSLYSDTQEQATGALEVEFQNAVGRTLTVTENKTPVAAPPGFVALDPSSFKIDLKEGAEGLTLQKVDYVIDITSKLPPPLVLH